MRKNQQLDAYVLSSIAIAGPFTLKPSKPIYLLYIISDVHESVVLSI